MDEQTGQAGELTGERQQLLELLLGEEATAGDAFRLSYAQQRLWFLDQLEPGSPAYNISGAARIRGRLDLGVLRRCLDEIVRRHETLRTTFVAEDGRPVQIVGEASPVALPLTDISGPSAEAEVERLAQEEARRPFDLSKGPLLRTSLLRLADEDHVLLLTMHHIVSDGWSMGVLVREVAALYGAFLSGRESPLEELPIQYADYAEWEYEHLQGELIEQQLAFWREKLGGTLPVLQLPTDRPRQATQTYNGARLRVALPARLTESLKALARREGVTLFMVLLAGFKALLQRYTGQDDIAVGSSVAGRTRAETEGLIGFFLNTLVMRTDLTGGPTFVELLGRVRETALGAYANQDVPVEMLLEVLQPERQLSHNPLFQVMLIFQNTPSAEWKIDDLTLTPFELDTGTAKFDLTFDLAEEAEGIHGALEYNSDLFDEETAARIARHYATLLEAAVNEPDESIARLNILDEAERRRLLVEWNDTARPFDRELCVHQLFERQASLTPEAVAIISGDEQITYAELNGRANRIAHRLLSLGVGPESTVGVCVERSPEMVAALLGVLKAGGAYVPLDPQYPRERLRLMLEDSGARVLLTQSESAEKFEGDAVRSVYLDASEFEGESDADPSVRVAPENLAYVIYTSGSTGRPKGVGVQHLSAANYFTGAREAFGLTPDDRVLQFASISFDASAEEIYPCLLSGAALVLRTDEMLAPASHFMQRCAEWGVTVLDLPVSFWQTLAAGLGGAGESAPDALRLLILGSEKAMPETLAAWNAYTHERVRVLNTYGPTEVTIVSTMCDLPNTADGASRGLPIGRPVSNVLNYVLDAALNPVPVGVAGELYVGGLALARGYLNRPDATAERFVPDPFSMEPGARLYRTGDLARYLADGRIEFLGRADEQVKIRGFRIEPGEIEAALGEHPQVERAAVVAREDEPGEKMLAAYVVAKPGEQPAGGELRAHLKERLPDYMIPAAFVMLDELPLTRSDKVDKRSLPAPDAAARLAPDHEYVAPRTPVEEVLAAAWAETLGVERVGAHDNFFELGGHSLLATQVISRVRETFRIELPLRSVFEAPTLAGMAERVEAAVRAEDGLELPPVEPAQRDGDLPLSFAQERMWFLHRLHPESVAYHVMRPLRIRGRLDIELLEGAFTELVRRHEIYRTIFPAKDGRPIQLVQPPHAVKLTPVDLRDLPEAEREAYVERVIEEEGRTPFDLARGPLWRLRLLWLADEEHLLMFAEHHMVHDGWTEWRLVSELMAAYEALAKNERSPLPDLPIQYADFAVWQRKCLAGAAFDTQLEYWKRQLASPPAPLELPSDRPRPPVQTFRGETLTRMLPSGLERELNEFSRRQHCTLFMTLFAAFSTLLHRYTRQDDLFIGSPIAGRNRAELEQLIGFFVNTLVIRADLAGDPTFVELLGRVRETALGAYAHQEMPFEKLVEEISPARHLNRQPLFQVMFVLHNAPSRELEIPGVQIDLLRVHNGTAKFDLLFSVREEEHGLRCVMEYSTDLFDEETVARMLAQYETLLRGVVEDASRRVSELPMLTADEERQLLSDWNQTRAPYPIDKTVSLLFEEQVARTPDAEAAVFGSERLTYRELNERANQLARHLRSIGVAAESRVAVCLRRSPRMLAAVLGVLKAGGAYVPLDAAYPRERLAYMMEDAGVSLVLAEKALAGALPSHSLPVVLLDADAAEVARHGGENLAPPVAADTLAYVTYTSGSTGKPKGIAMTQRPLLNLLTWMLTHTELPAAARTLQFASLSFDVSFQDIFSTLLSGGTVVLVSEAERQDIMGLARVLTEQGVHRLFIPAVALQQLAEGFVARGDFSAPLRKVIAGSEQLLITPAVVKMFESLGRARLHNEYGPSEAHVVTELALEGEPESWPKRPSVGRPISNTQIYILDRRSRPTPIGVPGELLIGGAGLARCYLNRPDLTAEKFVPDPFSAEPGARLYRTGDLARYLASGQIEFLGRMDHQLKIRGFRIEPGEIESALGEHMQVQEALVVAHEHAPGDKRLLAYIVPQPDAHPGVAELRAHLRETLPDYMIPSTFIMLPAVPLTPNGKVDRRALPLPEQARPELEQEFVAPRGALEEVIAGVWAELLGVERVGAEDNFFELGGHSLLAVQVTARLSEEFQTELPLRFIFESPTVGGLADRMRQSEERPGDTEKMARLLKQIMGLSEEEAQAMLEG